MALGSGRQWSRHSRGAAAAADAAPESPDSPRGLWSVSTRSPTHSVRDSGVDRCDGAWGRASRHWRADEAGGSGGRTKQADSLSHSGWDLNRRLPRSHVQSESTPAAHAAPRAMHSTTPLPLSSPTAIGWTTQTHKQNLDRKHGPGPGSGRSPLIRLMRPAAAEASEWALSPILARQRSQPHSDSPSLVLPPRLASGTPDPRRSLTVSAASPRGPAIALLNASADMHSPNTSPTVSPPSMSPPTVSPSIDSSWSAQSSAASAAAFSFHQHSHSGSSGDGAWLLSPSPPVLPESSPRSALIARESLQQDASSMEAFVSASCPVTPTYAAAAADTIVVQHARAESQQQQHRHLPPCHPYMPSAMEIAAFASLGNVPMPSASPTSFCSRVEKLSGESIPLDSSAPLTNGKEVHGPQGAGVECCGRSIFFQLPQSGISLAHRIIYIVSLVLLVATVAVMSFGQSLLTSLPAHCDTMLSWTLSCNLMVLSAMQIGQIGANFNWVGDRGVVHAWPAHVLKHGRFGFVGAAMMYYTGLLLYLAEGHKVITTRRLTLEGGIGVGMAAAKGTEPVSELPTLSLLFPSAAHADHTGCGQDDRFGTFYVSTLLLNLALWLFFFGLLVHLLSVHHRDSPATRNGLSAAATNANAQKCNQCNGPVNTSKWGLNTGRMFSWMRGRSSNLCPTCAYKHAAASSASVSPVNAPFVSGEVVWYVAPTPLQPVVLPSSSLGRRGSSDRWFQRWLTHSWLDKLGALPGDRNQGRLGNAETEGRHRRSPSNPDLTPSLSDNAPSDSSSLIDVAPGRRSSSDGSPSPPAPMLSPTSLSASGAFEVIFRRYIDRSPSHTSASGGASEGDCFVCLLHDLTSVMRTNVMHLRRDKDMHATGANRGFAHNNTGSRVQKHLV